MLATTLPKLFELRMGKDGRVADKGPATRYKLLSLLSWASCVDPLCHFKDSAYSICSHSATTGVKMYDDSREATNKWISHFYRYTKWRVLSSSYIADNVGKICIINAIVSVLFELVCHILSYITLKFQSKRQLLLCTLFDTTCQPWQSLGQFWVSHNWKQWHLSVVPQPTLCWILQLELVIVSKGVLKL